jgi:hypothetical protein
MNGQSAFTLQDRFREAPISPVGILDSRQIAESLIEPFSMLPYNRLIGSFASKVDGPARTEVARAETATADPSASRRSASG